MGRTTRSLRRAVRRRLDAAHGDSGVGSRAAAPGRAGGDRGMTAIEFVLLTPVLFFMIFATVQFGMYYFADHVAQAAARAGARKARDEAATGEDWSGDASKAASDYISQLGPELLIDPQVSPSRDPQDAETVRVRVTATVPKVFPLPGFSFRVNETSSGPVERFVPDNGG
ncbi:TadE family protein [Actinacidiphila sp. bgisy144]|jgi:Flp pilus assembly protein TadG|uniref:TadE family protein n=1 Tax=unclassified Actinacidiphila TaxID=2995708 RepID=UPI003EBCB6E0